MTLTKIHELSGLEIVIIADNGDKIKINECGIEATSDSYSCMICKVETITNGKFEGWKKSDLVCKRLSSKAKEKQKKGV